MIRFSILLLSRILFMHFSILIPIYAEPNTITYWVNKFLCKYGGLHSWDGIQITHSKWNVYCVHCLNGWDKS